MINYIKNSNKIKDFSLDFSKNISKLLSLPISKAIADLILGIIKSQSVLLSEISRCLNEDIKIKDTVDRLSKNLDKISYFSDNIWFNYYQLIKQFICEKTCFHIDNSDVAKECSSNLENLDKIVDASSKDNKIVNGYTVTEIVATNSSGDLPFSMYSKIFSSLSDDFVSKNNETMKAVDQIISFFGNIGTYVMDRGYDDKKIFESFNIRNAHFIIRGKDNRNVFYNNEKINIMNLSKKFKGKFSTILKIKGEKHKVYFSYVKINIDGVEKPLYAIFVHFKNSTSVFYTNIELKFKKDALNIINNYYMRWRIEEYFKYKKQSFDFENFRVRTLAKINALNLMLTLAISCIFLLSHSFPTLKVTLISIAKVIKKNVRFEYYRITKGIKIILSYSNFKIRDFFKRKKPPKNVQLNIFEMT